MLSSQQGSIYRTILAIVIGVAFCFALAWPQYTKYRNGRELNHAAELGRALAFAQGSYKQKTGEYTPQFNTLNISLPCPMALDAQGPYLNCPHYTYRLQKDDQIDVHHKQLPLWLLINIAQGSVQCLYEENNWAGQDLCGRLQ